MGVRITGDCKKCHRTSTLVDGVHCIKCVPQPPPPPPPPQPRNWNEAIQVITSPMWRAMQGAPDPENVSENHSLPPAAPEAPSGAVPPKMYDAAFFDKYRQRLDGLSSPEAEHIKWMMDKIPVMMAEGKREKAMRWLGFVQGWFFCQRLFTIEDMKTHNR